MTKNVAVVVSIIVVMFFGLSISVSAQKTVENFSKVDQEQNLRLDRLEQARKARIAARKSSSVATAKTNGTAIDKTARDNNLRQDEQIGDLEKSNQQLRDEVFGKDKVSLSERIDAEGQIRDKADKLLNAGIDEVKKQTENASWWHWGLLIFGLVTFAIAMIALLLHFFSGVNVNQVNNPPANNGDGVLGLNVDDNPPAVAATTAVPPIPELTVQAPAHLTMNNVTVVRNQNSPLQIVEANPQETEEVLAQAPTITVSAVTNAGSLLITPVIDSVDNGRNPYDAMAGWEITINGSNFMQDATVFLQKGDDERVAATEVFFNSGNQLVFVAPEMEVGRATLIVHNPGGQEAILVDGVNYIG